MDICRPPLPSMTLHSLAWLLVAGSLLATGFVPRGTSVRRVASRVQERRAGELSGNPISPDLTGQVLVRYIFDGGKMARDARLATLVAQNVRDGSVVVTTEEVGEGWINAAPHHALPSLATPRHAPPLNHATIRF